MSKLKVIVSRAWPAEVEATLKEKYDVQLNETDVAMSKDEMKQALGNCDAFLPTVTDPVDAEVLSAEPLRTRFIGNFGVGFNHIDLDAAKARGLTVTNTPEVLTDCTADIAMTLLLTAARRTSEGERHLRANAWTGWRPTHLLATKVTGKTLGMIGMGRIAQAMAKRAHHGFGMKIIFVDPYPPSDEVIQEFNATRCESIDEVLANSDFVSIHCPGGKETYHLLNKENLSKMKSSAFLINSARGDVVDNDALIEALKNGTIAGAGLDVFEGEPNLDKRFLELENAVLLPHLGSASTETRIAMGNRVLENLAAFEAGDTPRDKLV
ncbi:MAG: D-glycerate dehydrogenase [Proteobacteria bacterium]|nr:D-glycerate dehydrogenase [Gammaproteobacteria bacterium]MXY14703.1 D-glycerate dehydrogenase [Pseudomonadota bacterium]